VLPIISHWDSYEELHLSQDGASPHFLLFLFVRGLTAVLLVGGLGVEDKQNDPEEFPILLQPICFCAVG
jgi:hypothetical protein